MNKDNIDKVYFLGDEPREDLQKGDAFGHSYYARALYQILEKTKTTKAYAIGLFGDWGVGKTTIINELCRLIKEVSNNDDSTQDHKYTVCILDAWVYSEKNFRREFLLDIADKFNYLDWVRDKITLKKSFESRAPQIRDKKWYFLFLKQFFTLLSLLIISLFILEFFELRIEIESPGWVKYIITATFAILAAVWSGLFENIKGLVTYHPTIIQVEPPIHPDQFREIFIKLLKRKEAGLINEDSRLVIVLDNLDRCKEETVIEILGAVKTFLMEDRCIYILPCDDEGLKQHIMNMRTGSGTFRPMTKVEANDYLRKFFQTMLTIRPLLIEDLELYTNKILDRLVIFDLPINNKKENGKADKEENTRKRNRDEVAAVFRIAVWKNPRRVKQLANKLSANYILAQEKGKENPQLRNNILTNLGFLSKLTVIEDEWPEFYNLILEYPDIMNQLNIYFRYEDASSMPELLRKKLDNKQSKEKTGINSEWYSGLEDFLRRTNPVHSDDVSDFLLFKQKPTRTKISNYHGFVEAALNRQSEIVVSSIRNEDTDINAAFDELLQVLHEHAYNRKNVPNSTNVVYCIAKAFVLIPKEQALLQQKVADKVAETMSKKFLEDKVLDVGLPELLSVLESSRKKPNVEQIISKIIDGIDINKETKEIKGEQQLILNELVEHSTLLSKTKRDRVRKKFADVSQNQNLMQFLRKFSDKCLTTDETLAKELIPQNFYEYNISLMGTPDEAANKTLEFLKHYFPFFETNTINQYCALIIEHLTDAGQPADPITPRKRLGLNCIKSAPPTLFKKDMLKTIVDQLATCYQPLGNITEKDEVTDAYLHLLQDLSPEHQEVYHPHIMETISRSDPAHLIKLIKVVKEFKDQFYELSILLKRIGDRTQELIDNKELRKAFYNLTEITRSRNLIQDLVENIWGQRDEDLQVFEEIRDVLRVKEFRELVDKVLKKTMSIPSDKIEGHLEAIGNYYEKYDQKYLYKLISTLLNELFKQDFIEVRRGAKKLWQGIKERAVKEEKSRFYERIIEYSKQHINADTITEEKNKQYIETLLEDLDKLYVKQRNEFIDVSLRMIEEAKPQTIKDYGHLVLRQLSGYSRAQKNVPKAILDGLELGQDESETRNSFQTLIKYKSSFSGAYFKRLTKFFKDNPDNPIIIEFRDFFTKNDI